MTEKTLLATRDFIYRDQAHAQGEEFAAPAPDAAIMVWRFGARVMSDAPKSKPTRRKKR